MKATIVGAGPIGTLSAIALARKGFEVEIVDRDPGPQSDESWRRRGVMQFHHPHVFRKRVHGFLADTAPDVWDSLIAAGCIAAPMSGADEPTVALQSRRETFERVLRTALVGEPDVTLLIGHVDDVVVSDARLRGVMVDGELRPADVAIVAAGRGSHLGDALRPAGELSHCGTSYVSRMYRALPGVHVPVSPFPLATRGPGYLAAMFPQDDDILTLLILRPCDDDAYVPLRTAAVFDRVAAAIPALAPWSDPTRFEPIAAPLPGPELTNSYRRQAVWDGVVSAPGVFFVGDSVLATNPSGGRGISTGVVQIAELVRILGQQDLDLAAAVLQFEAFCERAMKPWFDDHVDTDASFLRAVTGGEIDPDASISSDVVVAALDEVPGMDAAAFAYLNMDVLPTALDPFREDVRAALRSGWRPRAGSGPTRDELDRLIRSTASA